MTTNWNNRLDGRQIELFVLCAEAGGVIVVIVIATNNS